MNSPAGAPAIQSPVTVFLDRDGVINADVGYLTDVSMLSVLDGAPEAIRTLNEGGFNVVVVTNQSAIGRGLMGHATLTEIHRSMASRLSRAGATVDSILYCPHTPDDGCSCRKPAPGLLRRAAEQGNVAFERSYLVGDNASDISAGREAGVRRCILVQSTRTSPEAAQLADFTCPSLTEAVAYIMNDASGGLTGE